MVGMYMWERTDDVYEELTPAASAALLRYSAYLLVLIWCAPNACCTTQPTPAARNTEYT